MVPVIGFSVFMGLCVLRLIETGAVMRFYFVPNTLVF